MISLHTIKEYSIHLLVAIEDITVLITVSTVFFLQLIESYPKIAYNENP
jgi:hypothetical protein